MASGSNLDSWHEAMAFYTRIDARLGGIAVSYLATMEKLQELSAQDWFDEELDRFENKMRMKDLGGAAFQYSIFLHENSILALAKAVEDTSIEFKRFCGFKFDAIKSPHGVRYIAELQAIRALSNVIKHNVSRVERASSESAKHLVDECGVRDGEDLGALILTGSQLFNVVDYIPKVYLSLLELVEKALGERHRMLDDPLESVKMKSLRRCFQKF